MEMPQEESPLRVAAREYDEAEENRKAKLEALKDAIWEEYRKGQMTVKQIVEDSGRARATVYAVVEEKAAAEGQAAPAGAP
jgi:hypothetical protein